MQITDFKPGKLITRTARCNVYAGDKFLHADGSYAGDRLEFVGYEKGIIMLVNTKESWMDTPISLQGWDGWADDSWDYYPESLYQKAMGRIRQLFPDKQAAA